MRATSGVDARGPSTRREIAHSESPARTRYERPPIRAGAAARGAAILTVTRPTGGAAPRAGVVAAADARDGAVRRSVAL